MSYTGIGSGSGKCLLGPSASTCSGAIEADTVDFVASDSLLSNADYQAQPSLQMYPTVAAAVVPIYNLPSVTNLTLTSAVLAQIFSGAITEWDDPRILITNIGVQIPANQPIKVVVRNDESGTTEIFKKSLRAFDSTFGAHIGLDSSTSWPNVNVTKQKGSNGVCAFVLATPYSIGYVSLGSAVAHDVPMASLLRGGSVVEPSLISLQYAVLQQGLQFGNNGDDPKRLTANLHNAASPSAWPIAGYTYLVMDKAGRPHQECSTVEQLVEFWHWFWYSSAAQAIASEYGFCPLPTVIRDVVVTRFLEDMKCNGELVWNSAKPMNLVLRHPPIAAEMAQDLFILYKTDHDDVYLNAETISSSSHNSPALLTGLNTMVLSLHAPIKADNAVSLLFAAFGVAVVSQVDLVLDGITLAQILEGTITTWLHPQILQLNPQGIVLPTGVPLNDTEQRIVLLQDPFIIDSLENLMPKYLPGYTGRAFLAAPPAKTTPALYAMVMGTPFAMAVTPLRDIDSSAYDLKIAKVQTQGGTVVTPSWQAVEACASADAYNPEEDTFQLQNSHATGCYPLSQMLYVNFLQPTCSAGSSNMTMAGEFLDWLFSNDRYTVALHDYHWATFQSNASPGKAHRTAVLDTVLCRQTNNKQNNLLVISLASVIGALLFICAPLLVFLWHATKRIRMMRKQFSNENIATQCAEAIARLDLESVSWLQSLPKPNKIQQSFIEIVNLLTEVKPFIPDHLLTKLQTKQQTPDNPILSNPMRTFSGSRSTLRTMSSPVTCVDNPGQRTYLPQTTTLFLNSSKPHRSILSPIARSSASPKGMWLDNPYARRGSRASTATVCLGEAGQSTRKRCTFMFVRFGFHGFLDEQRALHINSLIIKQLVCLGKKSGATIDQVTFESVSLFWGVANYILEGPLLATTLALDLPALRDSLPEEVQSDFWLHIAIGHGLCTVATLSAAGHRFFIAGGQEVSQAIEVVMKDIPLQIQCPILISSSVFEEVQYAVQCYPRVWFRGTLLWQPIVAEQSPEGPSEWMYELRNLEQGQGFSRKTLLHPFLMFHNGEPQAAITEEVNRIQAEFADVLSETDLASLRFLAGPNPYACRSGNLEGNVLSHVNLT